MKKVSVSCCDRNKGDQPRIRLGVCCLFRSLPIRFRTATAASLSKLNKTDALEKLSLVCSDNADSLLHAIEWCASHNIGAFRITSRLLPLATHPSFGYELSDLPEGDEVERKLRKARILSESLNVRLTFHPDQFVVLNSPCKAVLDASLRELEYHAHVAKLVGADVITLHGGGVYSDKKAALARLIRNMNRLPASSRRFIALENDDRNFSPQDILFACRETGAPMVYDPHHHRCLMDGLSVVQASQLAACTWKREPLFHLSSPLERLSAGKCDRRHHDFIRPCDFPKSWFTMQLTIEVEAKAKEIAVLRLQRWLKARLAHAHITALRMRP